MAGASGVQAESSKKEQGSSPQATASEEARCEGTRTYLRKYDMEDVTTNDLPNCPKGGLLLGTDGPDRLDGEDGDDEIRGLGAGDILFAGKGEDVLYGGDGNDTLYGYEYTKNDVEGQRDKLYCGKGKDYYDAEKIDYVDSSCEKENIAHSLIP